MGSATKICQADGTWTQVGDDDDDEDDDDDNDDDDDDNHDQYDHRRSFPRASQSSVMFLQTIMMMTMTKTSTMMMMMMTSMMITNSQTELPSCIPVQCDVPANPINGKAIYTAVAYKSVVSMFDARMLMFISVFISINLWLVYLTRIHIYI